MPRLIRLNLMQVVWMCFLVVAMVFIGYEVAERLWLRDANPGLQHTLHLLLGIAASALTATVSTYVLVCQFDECATDTSPLSVPSRWRDHLQHVSLRTKIMVPMIALAVLPAIGIGFFALSELRALVAGVPGTEGIVTGMRVFFVVALALMLGVSTLTGALLAHYVTRPVAVLRAATREIAAGDLSSRVVINTRDEIESLAADFNTMTERLTTALDQLSQWNAGLQQEVERRTGEIRGLQRGFARVDRLACVGQMTASIMHEIGNPLAAIKTKIQVAEEREGATPALTSVLAEVDRLIGVLRSYSRLSRLQSRAFAALDIGEVLRGVAVLVTPELARNGVTLECVIPDRVPPIHGDADRMRQLFINFILNAAEAIPAGGGQVRITVRVSGAGARPVAVEVADTGTGIPADMLERLWDPFVTTKPDGTGLGLAIAKQIVGDHDGSVHVESRLGEGTTIRVELPVLSGEQAAPESGAVMHAVS